MENQEEQQQTIRTVGSIVSGAYYDMQELRIATKNRIRDVIRKKAEGIAFDEVEEKKEKKDYEKKYSDKELFALWDKLLKEDKISKDEYKYVLKCWELSNDSEKIEGKYRLRMMDYVSKEPVYNLFLSEIAGIGPVLAANLLNKFGDCSRYDTISKLWAHSGNAIIDGKAPKKRKNEAINFSPKLRQITWVISDCLMKSNHGLYRQVYDTTKEKYLNTKYKKGELFAKYGAPYKEDSTELTKLHAHNRALQKMRKLFLSHYWLAARELSGQDTRSPYVEEHLQHKNILGWRDAVDREKKTEAKKV